VVFYFAAISIQTQMSFYKKYWPFSLIVGLVVGFWSFILLLGLLPEEKLTPVEGQVDHFENQRRVQIVAPVRYDWGDGNSGCNDPWEQDSMEETIEWQDFLEEIEMRGISLDDPEAREIWEDYH